MLRGAEISDASPTTCPDDGTIERLFAGALSAPEREALGAHLRRCPMCVARAEESTKDAPLLLALRTELTDRIDALRASVRAAVDRPLRWPVIDGYRIVRLIGEGGSARVFEAIELRPQRRVALRVLRELPQGTHDRRDTGRFVEGAALLAKYPHPGLPVVFAVGTTPTSEGGAPFMAMEYCEGEPLDLVAPAMSLVVRLGVLRDLAAVLAHCHEHGIAHGDVKPRNVLIAPNGAVKLVDFGLARHLGAGAIDLTCSIRGTPAYLSPERFDGGAVDVTSDLFALGVVACELLVGEHPFLEERSVGWAEAAKAVANRPRWTLRERCARLDPTVAERLGALLASSPGKRPRAAEIAQALAFPERVLRTERRAVVRKSALPALLLVGAVSVTLAVVSSRRVQRNPWELVTAPRAVGVIALSPELIFESREAMLARAATLRGELSAAGGNPRSRTASDLSLIEEALGNFDAAARLLEPEVAPSDARPNGRIRRGEVISSIRLARIRVAQARLDDAAALLDAIAASASGDPRARQQVILSELHSTRAMLHAARGKLDEARLEASSAQLAAMLNVTESGGRAGEQNAWFLFQRAQSAWEAIARVSGKTEDRKAALDARRRVGV